MFKAIKDYVESQFDVIAESEITANVMYIKVNGLDNNSLAKWIINEFDNCKVYVKQREGYKIHNLGWVKVESSDQIKSELVLTNDEYILD